MIHRVLGVSRARRRALAAVVVGCCAAVPISVVALAEGQTATAPFWTCQAHAATVNIGGGSGLTLDPLHANSDVPGAPCKDDGATAPSLAANNVLGINSASVASGSAQAQTGLTNGGGPGGNPPPSPSGLQSPAALAQIDNTDLALGGSLTGSVLPVGTKPGLEISAKVIRSYVSGFCDSTSPVIESGSPAFPSGKFADGSSVGGQVVDLRINGTAIPAEGQPDQALTELFQGLSPLAPIIKVVLNQVYTGVDPATGDNFIRREAVRIELLTAANSTPLATIVLGSATVDFNGSVCTSNTNPPGTVVTPPTFQSGSNEPGSNGGGVSNGGGQTVVLGSSTSSAPNNGTNASECVHLRMFFDLENGRVPHYNKGLTALTTRKGIRRVVRGTIHNCQGRSIVAAKLDVIHIINGKPHLLKTGLRSRPGGRLTMILPNNLTTRTIEFDYRPFTNRAMVAGGGRVRLHLRVVG
jgi:hypothetical protein